MICYVALGVSLCGLEAKSPEEVAERVRRLLLPEFGQRFDDDVEVEVESWAGSPEDPREGFPKEEGGQ